ncbi:MAG: dihydroorotase [Acidimicrobiia bacterium]|nr:dihydroorotase [Acidimicrobiia bacterium]
MSVLIEGGVVVDTTGERRADVLVVDGRIAAVGEHVADDDVHRTLDAGECVVTPGFVDLHAHLREPGREDAETIETGSRAAARGGYTAVVAMPNTDPAHDSRGVVEFVRRQGLAAGLCEVLPAGCITMRRAGESLAPYAELVAAGVRIFTDDGNGVQDPLLMRRAMEYSLGLDMVLAQHCEVARLTQGAVMHEGACCSELGLPGWPALAEELMVHRDIELARLTGARIHLLHLSTAGSVELVRAAKADGVAVTAEVAPHHLSLTDEALRGYDPLFKVNPPLRTPTDIAALAAGLADGTVDAIATDHAPHPADDKERPLDQAPPGMVGLETALGVALAALDMPLADVVGALSWKPAAIAGVADRHGRPVAPGEPANLCVFDPHERWQVRPAALASRGHNTPYIGRDLRGKVRHTLFAGNPVVIDGVAQR